MVRWPCSRTRTVRGPTDWMEFMAVKPAIAILMMTLMIAASGCATQYYPDYARGQAAAARAAAKTNGQVLAALGEALKSPEPGARTAAAMGLAFWLARHRPVVLEQARPSPIEQGLGKMIPSLPMWAAMYGMFTQSVKNAGDTTRVDQEVSGNGAGGLNLGAGETSAATSVMPVPLE